MRLQERVRQDDGGVNRVAPATRPARVAIVGFGTVGRSVARLLQELAPPELQLAVIVNRSVHRKRVDWVDPGVRWSDDINDALGDDVDVVVELIGGRSPAEEWIRQALRAGKSVVTANKQVIAHAGPELLDEAARSGRHLRFEAAVAGGVPVVRAIEQGLAGDSLTRVAGILNGTCNYILSRMERERVTFQDALAEAQALGFAEADPSQDIEGFDAQAKLAILAHIAFGVHVRASAIESRRVDVVDAVDFVYAGQMGCTIRQIAWAERTGRARRAESRSGTFARAARLAARARSRERKYRDAPRPIWRRDHVWRAGCGRRADRGRGAVGPAGDREGRRTTGRAITVASRRGIG